MPFMLGYIYYRRKDYQKKREMLDKNIQFIKGECCVCMDGADIPLTMGVESDLLCAVLSVSKLEKKDITTNYICNSCLGDIKLAYYFNLECKLANQILDMYVEG